MRLRVDNLRSKGQEENQILLSNFQEGTLGPKESSTIHGVLLLFERFDNHFGVCDLPSAAALSLARVEGQTRKLSFARGCLLVHAL